MIDESEFVSGFVVDLTKGKICKECGIHKDYELYYFQNKESNIYASYCKQCVNRRSKQYNSTEVGSKKLYAIQKNYRIRSGKQPADKPLTIKQINKKIYNINAQMKAYKIEEDNINKEIDDLFVLLNIINRRQRKNENKLTAFNNK